MEIKKSFLTLVLLFSNVLIISSQEIFDDLYDFEISNACIKVLVSEIKNHFSEIPDDKNYLITEDFELIANSIERYETKADEVSGKKILQGEIYYQDKKEDVYLLIRKYKYNDGHCSLSFSYVKHGIEELKVVYFWNSIERKDGEKNHS